MIAARFVECGNLQKREIREIVAIYVDKPYVHGMILPPCGYFPGIEPGKFLNSEFYKSKPGAKPPEQYA